MVKETQDKLPKKVKIQVVEEPSETSTQESVAEKKELEEKLPEEPKEEKKEAIVEEKASEEKKATKIPQDKIPFWILFFCFLVGLALGAGLIGGIFYYKSSIEKAFPEVGATPTPLGSPIEPTTTPQGEKESEKVDLSKYSVKILNGSGIAGEAGKVQTLLEKAGFTRSTTGNAKSYDYKETEIATKESIPEDVSTEVMKSLSSYKTKKASSLPSSSSYDIVITVGKEKS